MEVKYKTLMAKIPRILPVYLVSLNQNRWHWVERFLGTKKRNNSENKNVRLYLKKQDKTTFTIVQT